jgi:hypothetical protein
MSDLILMLANKLATAALGAGEQLRCIRGSNPKAEDLIQVLSLQAITQSKTRLAADDLVSFRKTSSLSQRTVSSGIFTESTIYSSLNIREKKLSILNLIKDSSRV